MRTKPTLVTALSIGLLWSGSIKAADEYEFRGGFPTAETASVLRTSRR